MCFPNGGLTQAFCIYVSFGIAIYPKYKETSSSTLYLIFTMMGFCQKKNQNLNVYMAVQKIKSHFYGEKMYSYKRCFFFHKRNNLSVKQINSLLVKISGFRVKKICDNAKRISYLF